MKDKEGIVKAWLVKAEHDLGTAIITHQHLPDYRDTICYHCHQAVEKYLKAYLIYLEIPFKPSHDLVYLLNLIASKHKLPDKFYEMSVQIENYGVQIRYPDEIIEPNDAEVNDAIRIAEDFRDFITSKMVIKS
ncbi:MAG: HEPN domain-containing protein [FCB group bacterium]|jgi:HEPN domain-containing protein